MSMFFIIKKIMRHTVQKIAFDVKPLKIDQFIFTTFLIFILESKSKLCLKTKSSKNNRWGFKSGVRRNGIREDHGRAKLQLLLQWFQISRSHAVNLIPVRQEGRRERSKVVTGKLEMWENGFKHAAVKTWKNTRSEHHKVKFLGVYLKSELS